MARAEAVDIETGKSIKFKIDKEFSEMLDAQTNDERHDLREQMLAEEGNRDPAVIWKGHGILIAGHNREEICAGEGWKLRIVQRDFPSRAAVRRFILTEQLGRRNLSPQVARTLRGKLYNGSKNTGKGNAAKKIAKQTGVSERTVKRDGQRQALIEKLPKKYHKQLEQSSVNANVIEWLGSLPAKDLGRSVKELLSSTGRKGSKPAKKAKPAKSHKQRHADIIKGIEKLFREVCSLRSDLGTTGGRSVVAKFDELSQSLSRWSVE